MPAIAKPVTKSRTNRTVAAIVTVVAAKALSHYLPAELAHEVAAVLTDEVVGVVATGLGALAVYYRQAANRGPADEQDRVTPRPK